MSTKIQDPDLKKANEPGHWGTTTPEPKKQTTVKEKEGASSAHSYEKAPKHGGEVNTDDKKYRNTPEVPGSKPGVQGKEPQSYPSKAQLYDEKQPSKKGDGVADVPVPNETSPSRTERPDRAGQVGEERPETPGKSF